MESSDRRKPNGRKSKTFCCLSGRTQTSITSAERRVLEVKVTDQYSVNTFKYVYFFGKTIEKVGFTNDGDTNDKMFIILFTDKTFIAIKIEHDEDNSDEYHFADAFMYDIWGHEDAEAMYNCWVDSDGNVHLGEKIQMMVDLGLWNFTEEDAKRVRENYIKKQEEREWARYLQLKEKFKDRDKEV